MSNIGQNSHFRSSPHIPISSATCTMAQYAGWACIISPIHCSMDLFCSSIPLAARRVSRILSHWSFCSDALLGHQPLLIRGQQDSPI